MLVVVLLTVMAGLEWWRYLVPSQPNPLVISAAALLAIHYFVWQIVRLRPRLKQLRQGIEGERVVGQYLERLRSDGYQVFHDLVGDGFNVDLVVVGPAGAAHHREPDAWSKPARGKARIDFDGESVVAAGYEPADHNPVA